MALKPVGSVGSETKYDRRANRNGGTQFVRWLRGAMAGEASGVISRTANFGNGNGSGIGGRRVGGNGCDRRGEGSGGGLDIARIVRRGGCCGKRWPHRNGGTRKRNLANRRGEGRSYVQ